MRIGLVASARFPIAEPFAGGLEAHTWSLARGLRARGHDVTVFAAPGSDPALQAELLPVRRAVISDTARADVSMSPEWWLEEHHAYLALMLELRDAPLDVVHNNSLHYLPVAMAASLRVPVLTTLHTPPTPWLESAIQAPPRCPVAFTAVSRYTADAWRHVAPDVSVVHNGVDVDRWRQGPGGGPAVWSGRLVPEKGPHLAAAGRGARRRAAAARRAGHGPRLVRRARAAVAVGRHHLRGPPAHRRAGDPRRRGLRHAGDAVLGRAVRPRRRGVPRLRDPRRGLRPWRAARAGRRPARPPGRRRRRPRPRGALLEAVELDRDTARAHAVATCSLDTMLDAYELLYAEPPIEQAA